MDEVVGLIPSPSGVGSEYIELARSKQGRVFKKHILTKGELIHPVTRQHIKIDDSFVGKLIENFQNKVCDIVQVPLANDKNEHSEDPTRNIGEVIGLEQVDDKVYALIDARKEGTADALGKTLLGASAYLSTNYMDNKLDKRVGPTLMHVAVTNRPYVTELDDYEELIAATADISSDVVVLSNVSEDKAMTKDELIAELKTHGIDVNDIQLRLSASESDGSLVQKLGSALAQGEFIALSAGQPFTTEAVLEGVSKLAEQNVALSTKVEENDGLISELQEENEKYAKLSAESTVDALVAEGRILPAQRETYIELKLTNDDMFGKLVPEKALVALSAEEGTNQSDETGDQKELDIEAEIARLSVI